MIKKIFTIIASFIIMLCLGGVYAWSIVVPELMNKYNFSAAQSQFIFGLLIGILPLTMIFAGNVEERYGTKFIGLVSALFFFCGYIISGFSKGNFFLLIVGNGLLAGISTGFGYLAALTSTIKCFPEKKGLMTGIAVSGFGLAATILSYLVDGLLRNGKDILQIFTIIGTLYGSAIFISSFFLNAPLIKEKSQKMQLNQFLKSPDLYQLIFGFFFGTFAGLLIVGSLKPIGNQQNVSNDILIIGVSVFAFANFVGRIVWGFISDIIGANLTIFLALMLQSFLIILIGILPLSNSLFIFLATITGFAFGGNFVLFAKETAEVFGIERMGMIYPYVSIGYALGGIFGPLTGGILFDQFQNYFYATCIASFISFLGATIFLIRHKIGIGIVKPN